MIFDPVYMMFMAPALALSLWASWRVKANFNKYSSIRCSRGHSPNRRREQVPGLHGHLRRNAGIRIRTNQGLSVRPRCQQWSSVFRECTQGNSLYRTMRSSPHTTALFTEHHRLHGWTGIRGWRHSERRGQDGYGRCQRRSSQIHGHHWQFLWRGQLRYVRARLRSSVPVDVAQRQDFCDGW